MKRRKGLLDEEKFLPPLPEQLPRGVSSLPGYGQTSPIAQGLLGFTGRQPTYSVMDPQAQQMSDAYRLGEQASVASQLYGSMLPFAAASTMASAQRAGSLLSPLTVFHGSPHKFSKFDASKIGTGEGAQVYGHGLYFAENPAVAKDYQRRLSDQANSFEWQGSLYEKSGVKDPITHALGLTYHQGSAFAKKIAKQGIADAKAGDAFALDMGGVDYYQKMLDVANKAKKSDIKPISGAFYKVDLPDEQIAKMLDWDKPLSQQNDYVQKAIRSQMPDKSWEQMKGRTGRDYYEFYWGGSPHGASASGHLTELGIPGIRYLDEGSRAAKKGTSNFVVFPGEESKLRIMEVNGKPVVIDEAFEIARQNAVKMLGLPEANTAMDRARAMGFVDAYHGTTGDIRNFDKQFRGATTGAPSAKRADFAASKPQVAVGYSLLGEGREINAINRELAAAEKARDWNKVEDLTVKLEDATFKQRDIAAKVSDERFEAEKKFGDVLNKYGVQQDFYSNRPQLGDYKEESEMLARMAVRKEAYDRALAKIPSAVDQNKLWERFEKANGGSVLWDTPEEYRKILANIQKKDPDAARLYKASNEGGWENLPEFQKDPKALEELNKAFNDIKSLDADYYALGIPQGANVMPLMIRTEGMNVKDFKGSRYRDESYNELIKEAIAQRKPGVVMKQTYDPGQKAYDELTDIYAITDPSRIRSRFAAFDPARAKEADLLAGIGTVGAGLLSPAVLEYLRRRDEEGM